MSRRSISTAFACIIALLWCSKSHAFPPSASVGAITPGESHAAITKTSMATIYAELGLTSVSGTMADARSKILDANANVDDLYKRATAYHCDAENFNRCNFVITSNLGAAVQEIRDNRLDFARESFGTALHTLQDFYAHSNWIELGNNGLHPQLGRPGSIASVSPATANGATTNEPTCIETPPNQSCMRNNLVTPLLTSGYFSGQDRTRPAGKCRHGGAFDASPGIGGISKDMSSCVGVAHALPFDSPHSDSHPAAAALAARASAALFRQLQARVTPRQFMAFLGAGAPFAFAIDTTGSMGSIINGVKNQVNAIIDARANTPQQATQYVLAPFGDPDVPAALVTENAGTFKSALAGLVANGGGDCPELSMQGLFNAVAAADSGAQVYLFTDASAKDAARMGSILDLATHKKSRVFAPLFGSCSPYDPAYFALARHSGGQVFILNPAEAGQVARLSDIFSRTDSVDILSVTGTLSPTPRTYQFPVDSRMTRLNISVATVAGATVAVRRPDGSALTAATAGVVRIPLSNATVYSLAAPATGTWSVTVSGADQFSILVNGASDLTFPQFRFVEQRGRPGHEGAYAIAGSPAPGRNLAVQASLGRSTSAVTYEFRTPEGQVLNRFTLSGTDPSDHLVQSGQVAVPTVPFKVYAMGRDEARIAFQRVIGHIVTPQTVSVVAPVAVSLPRGQVTTYRFAVHNAGATDTFAFSAVDDRHFVRSVSPATATIASGASALVTVSLSPAAAVAPGTVDTLTFSAASSANPMARNYAVLSSAVVGATIAGDVNRDGVVDCDDLGLVRASFGARAGSPAFNPNVDLDSSALIDALDLATVGRLVPAGTVCK